MLCRAGFLDSHSGTGSGMLILETTGFFALTCADPGDSTLQRGRFYRQNFYCLLQKLGIERANLLSCSMGAEMAIDFTLEHLEMVKSLVIVSGTSGGFEMQGERHLRFWRVADN